MHVKRLLLLLSLVLLTACAPSGAAYTSESAAEVAPAAADAPAGEVVQLVYQDWRTDWFPGMALAHMAEFHTSHPNIRVF